MPTSPAAAAPVPPVPRAVPDRPTRSSAPATGWLCASPSMAPRSGMTAPAAAWGGVGLYRWGRAAAAGEPRRAGLLRPAAASSPATGPDPVEPPAVAPWDTRSVRADLAGGGLCGARLAGRGGTSPGSTVDDGHPGAPPRGGRPDRHQRACSPRGPGSPSTRCGTARSPARNPRFTRRRRGDAAPGRGGPGVIGRAGRRGTRDHRPARVAAAANQGRSLDAPSGSITTCANPGGGPRVRGARVYAGPRSTGSAGADRRGQSARSG